MHDGKEGKLQCRIYNLHSVGYISFKLRLSLL